LLRCFPEKLLPGMSVNTRYSALAKEDHQAEEVENQVLLEDDL